MESKTDYVPVVQASTDEGASETADRAYLKMPQLSDRCGGSHDDSLLIPVPDGVVLPDCVPVINIGADDEAH